MGTTTSHRDQFADQARLLELIWGYMTSDLVDVATRLRIPDHIGTREVGSGELAEETGTHAPSLLRLLRALAALGLLEEPRADTFRLTPMGARLRADAPDSLYSFARQGTGVFRRAWEELEHSIRTGEPAFDRMFGKDFFGHLASEPELSSTFTASMRQATRSVAAALAAHHDFSRYGTVVDVGGADGSLLAAVLREHPKTRGVVFDSAEGAANAPDTVRAAGVEERCRVETGDFFRAVPEGGDLYLLKSILHDWNDERCVDILRACRRAVPEHGRLLVVEVLMPPRAASDVHPLTYLSDLYMFVTMGGKERTEREYAELFEAAGFTTAGVESPATLAPFSLIEAEPSAEA